MTEIRDVGEAELPSAPRLPAYLRGRAPTESD